MSGMIKITPARMRECCAAFRTEGDNYDACIAQMTNLLAQLETEWEGQACRQYVMQFQSLRPSFRAMRDLIDGLSQQLEGTATAMESLDQEISTKFQNFA